MDHHHHWFPTKKVTKKSTHPRMTSLFRSSLPTSYSPGCEKVSEVKWSEWSEGITFWVLYFNETFVCYRGCLNLSCYIVKKVLKNFLMGFKIFEVGGRDFFFFKILIGRTVFNFHAKLHVLPKVRALFE